MCREVGKVMVDGGEQGETGVMAKATPRTDISGYFKEISRRLETQVEILTPIVTHSGEMGDNDHLWFADLLRKYLPTRIGVDTGFVVNFESDARSRAWFETTDDHRKTDESIGPQSDILLLDVLENAPLCAEQAFRVCPIEMVLGVIEVTRKLDAAKLRTDLDRLQRVRALAGPEKKKYSAPRAGDASSLRPRAYVVGLKTSVSFAEILGQVEAIDDDLRPNAVLLLDKALYIRRPYTTEFYKVTSDILFQFLAVLRLQIESFPLGNTDLGAYLPGVASLVGRRTDGDTEAPVTGRRPPEAECSGYGDPHATDSEPGDSAEHRVQGGAVGPCSLGQECFGPRDVDSMDANNTQPPDDDSEF